MKKLYIDVDGVLLTANETRAADYVSSFIDYITSNFDCYWLTTHCNGDITKVINHLSEYLDQEIVEKLRGKIKPTFWKTLKTEAIDFSADFYWLDDNPLRFEVDIINAKSLNDSLIVVNLNRQDELMHVMTQLKP